MGSLLDHTPKNNSIIVKNEKSVLSKGEEKKYSSPTIKNNFKE